MNDNSIEWTEEQKATARPRILQACRSAQAAADKQDFELFWMLNGLIAGGMEKLGYPDHAAAHLRAGEAEGSIPDALAAIAASMSRLLTRL